VRICRDLGPLGKCSRRHPAPAIRRSSSLPREGLAVTSSRYRC
jgi:hypothetical protein